MTLRAKIKLLVQEQRWTIGFIEESIDNIVAGNPFCVHYLKGLPKDRWFADPFILDNNNDTIVLLVEEFLYKTRLGRIAKLTIRKEDYLLIDDEVVLELDSHLSFPAIKREGGKVYIYPENAGGFGLALYEYDEMHNKCTYLKTICVEPLADAIITGLFGEEMLFTTKIPNHNGNELSVYKFYNNQPSLFTVCGFDSNIARNAGDWFKVGNNVYRPAQDCNGGYGMAVLLQKVSKNADSFRFDTIRKIESTNTNYTTGCHTFNSFNGLSVIDVHGMKNPRAAKIYSFVRKFL